MRHDNGQVVVMLAIIIPFLILMLAFLVNISLLIHQRIRLQNAADAGTYSAAASLARDLNHIAELNDNIDLIWHGNKASLSDPDLFIKRWSQSFEQTVDDTSFNGVEMAQALVKKYEDDYAAVLSEIEDVSTGAFARATRFGERAARLTYYNGNDALAEVNPAALTFRPAFNAANGPMLEYAEGSVAEQIGYVVNAGSCNAVSDACSAYENLSTTINIPIRKTNQIFYVGKAQAEPGFRPLAPNRFVVEPWQLTAVAAAQPYGGSIEGLSNTYGAALIRIGSKANDGGIYYH